MQIDAWAIRRASKRCLAPLGRTGRPRGCTILTYHRIDGGTPDERDVPLAEFDRQLDMLTRRPVLSLDEALDRLADGDARPTVVLTFDDGFADVYHHAWPRLRTLGLPFTVFVATAFVGGELRWEGSTAREAGGRGLTWHELREMVASRLCTVGAHTHDHVPPEQLTVAQLERCDRALQQHLGLSPRHFAYPWGIPVPHLDEELRARYRSAVTGLVGRNQPGAEPLRLRRIPVRRTDPFPFFARKVDGGLAPERIYDGVTRAVKRVGIRG